MASIATNVIWGSSPNIYFNFSYSKRRNGTTQEYDITVECKSLTGSSYFGYPIYLEISLDGTKVATKTLKASSPSQWSSAITYSTGWLKVTNKTAGTTGLKIRIYSGSGSTRDTNYNYTLDIDPAASKIAATDANIGSVSTVTFTRYNNSFTHTLAYMADGQTTYTAIFDKQNVSSYGWAVADKLYDLTKNKQTIGVTLRCQTYNGSTLVGTEACKMTATAAKDKCAPVVSVEATDSNDATFALTGDRKKIIKYHSDITVEAEVEERNGATIKSTTLKCGAKTFSGTKYTFTDAESIDISATATDTREYSTTDKLTGLALIEYIKLTANTIVKRTSPTADTVEITTTGNYFNGNFGVVNNTLGLQVQYKPKTKEAFDETDIWTEMTVTINENTYTAEATLAGLNYKQAYDIRVRAIDQIYNDGPLANAVEHTVTLNKGIPVFDWGEEDFRFNVPIYSGGARLITIYTSENGAAKLAQGDNFTFVNPSPSHKLFYVRLTTSNGQNPEHTYIPCLRSGDLIRGIGGHPDSSGKIHLFGAQILFTSDTTATVEYCGYWNTSDQVYAQRKIYEIFAVL